jgi:MFS transporter, Spinster family, sphingosine-1-phosphate transporter
MSEPTFRIRKPVSILVLLTLLNFVNYVDRYLVAAVSPAFQAQLGLSSFQTGLVISAFMVGYFVTSPVFGWLGDRSRLPGRVTSPLLTRTSLMAMGVLLWSVATAASGLATGATSMIFARIAVGVGEASYATIAPTIIDDLAPPERKNRWLAYFYLAIPVGSALGYLLGGFIEHRLGWRSAFYVCGGPGVLLAAFVLLVREPQGGIVKPQVIEGDDYRGTKQAVAPVGMRALRSMPLYLACVLGACAYTFALGGFAAWAPKFLFQVHGMSLADADFGFGLVAVVSGIVGTALGGLLADRGLPKDVEEERRVRRYLRFCAVTSAIALPAAFALLFAPTPKTFFLAIFVCETALFASTSPFNVVVLGSVPAGLRTTAMAVSIFAMHALGDFLSPPMVGQLADMTSLRNALTILPIAIALSAVIWWLGAGARMRSEAARILE